MLLSRQLPVGLGSVFAARERIAEPRLEATRRAPETVRAPETARVSETVREKPSSPVYDPAHRERPQRSMWPWMLAGLAAVFVLMTLLGRGREQRPAVQGRTPSTAPCARPPLRVRRRPRSSR